MIENAQLAALLKAIAAADAGAMEQLLAQGVAYDRYLPHDFFAVAAAAPAKAESDVANCLWCRSGER